MWVLFDWAHQGTLLGSAKTFEMQYEKPITRVGVKYCKLIKKNFNFYLCQ